MSSLDQTYWKEIVTDKFEFDRLSQDLFANNQLMASQHQPQSLPKSQRRPRAVVVFRSTSTSTSSQQQHSSPELINGDPPPPPPPPPSASPPHESDPPPQDTPTNQPETSNTNEERGDPVDLNESQQLGVLTQLIEPRKRKIPIAGNSNDFTLENFKQIFLDKTTTLDRAESHHESLQTARNKGKIPVKLRVNTQPNVMNKEDAEFQQKWKEATQQCEKKLLDLLIQHLQNIMMTTRNELREESKKCLHQLQTTMSAREAKETHDHLLIEADKTRQARKEEAKKKKRERPNDGKEPNPKAPKRPRKD